ncbi:hypothetical protein [Vaginella massiliensis]|nr:hypothetical protein [Vaginella massiliensis]
MNNAEAIELFTQLDDSDVMVSIKEWCQHKDDILRILSDSIVNRKIPKSILVKQEIKQEYLDREYKRIQTHYKIDDASYLMSYNTIHVLPYDEYISPIKILDKNGLVKALTQVEHQLISQYLSKESTKFHYYAFG